MFFIMDHEQFSNVLSQKLEFFILKIDFFEFGPPFSNLNILRLSKDFTWSTGASETLFSENFIFIHQDLSCKRVKINLLVGKKNGF